MRLPIRKLLNIIYVEAFKQWAADEREKRYGGISNPQLRATMPEPTKEEFEMLIDPDSAKEIDFFDDYVSGE